MRSERGPGRRQTQSTATVAAHPGLEQMKKLAGTWVEADKDGKPTDKVVSVIKVTAGGSAVQETLFPGQPQEMVSVYHMDGADLVMTHYCMLGNQPRMKADPELADQPDPVQVRRRHKPRPGQGHAHARGDAHLRRRRPHRVQRVAWVNGKPAENHCATMKLVRKK